MDKGNRYYTYVDKFDILSEYGYTFMNTPFSILIIDDEPPIRGGITNIIEMKLPTAKIISQACNGLEGFDLYKKYKPDLIISDIVMPKCSGLDLLKMIREHDATTAVILISGYDEFSYAKEAIRFGVSNYILKPISQSELITSILEIMQKQSNISSLNLQDIESLKTSAKTLFFQRLVNGEISTVEEISRTLANLDLSIKNTQLTLLTIASRSSKNEEYISECVRAYATEKNLDALIQAKHAILFLNMDSQQAAHHAQLLANKLNSACKQESIMGIGKTVEGLHQASSSFQSSLLAMSYHVYYEDRIVFDQSVITNEVPKISISDIRTEKLRETLLLGTDQEIELWIDAFFSLVFSVKTPPLSYVKGMCIFVISDIQKQIIETCNVDKAILKDADPIIFNQLNTLKELRERIEKYLLFIKHEVIPQAILDNDSIIYQTKKYVENHIGDIVSSSDIANRIGMNPTYFSTYFKSKTGENFRTYLNRTKDEYAKQLLSDLGLSIEEVSLRLGYTDYRSFHRIFKNINHITPNDYRKQMRESCFVITK